MLKWDKREYRYYPLEFRYVSERIITNKDGKNE